MALEPAIGLLRGLIVLSQHPSPTQLAAIALVVLAGAGAQRGGLRTTSTENPQDLCCSLSTLRSRDDPDRPTQRTGQSARARPCRLPVLRHRNAARRVPNLEDLPVTYTLASWKSWLAGLGFGLGIVPIADARSFHGPPGGSPSSTAPTAPSPAARSGRSWLAYGLLGQDPSTIENRRILAEDMDTGSWPAETARADHERR
jgi:hypothetical protein